jgi:hypothetical protein
MILPFSTQLNGKPTYFVEKIISGLYESNLLKFNDACDTIKSYVSVEKECRVFNRLHTPIHKGISKIHSIRADKNDRWHAGVLIDFFINNRTKDMFRFAPRVPVLNTQKVLITYTKTKKAMVFIDDKCFYMQDFSLEGNYKMLHLAQNDGFATIEKFFEYFNEDFTGKIIHWTDKKY